MTPATLLSLAARAEAGGDAELDADICLALGINGKQKRIYRRGHYIGREPVLLRVETKWPPLQTSLDALEAVGPAVLLVRHFDGGKWRAETERGGYFESGNTAPTEPLARLAAKLRSLAAQMEAGGG